MDTNLASVAKQQYRARDGSGDPFRNTASHEMGHAGPSVRSHDHEVRAVVDGRLREALGGFSGSNLGDDVQRFGGQPVREPIEALSGGLIALLASIIRRCYRRRNRAAPGRPAVARGQGTGSRRARVRRTRRIAPPVLRRH